MISLQILLEGRTKVICFEAAQEDTIKVGIVRPTLTVCAKRGGWDGALHSMLYDMSWRAHQSILHCHI